jgi:endonuclease/exonuclease/phosphatase (EEP) superfamily protein YafD
LNLPVRERIHWLLEPRRLVGGRFRTPSGEELVLVSLHCHDAGDPAVIAFEVDRLLADLRERTDELDAILMAGDFNARGRDHPAVAAMLAAGFREDGLDGRGIDHIFHRGMTAVAGPTTVPDAIRHHRIETPAGARTVILSDHGILRARYRVGTG